MNVKAENPDNTRNHNPLNRAINDFKSAIAEARIIENRSDMEKQFKNLSFAIEQLTKENKRVTELRDSFNTEIKQLKADIARLEGGQPADSDTIQRLVDNNSHQVVHSLPLKSSTNYIVQTLSTTPGARRHLRGNRPTTTSHQVFFLALHNRAAKKIDDLCQQLHGLQSRSEVLVLENGRIDLKNAQLYAKRKSLAAYKHHLESQAAEAKKLQNMHTELLPDSPLLSSNYHLSHCCKVSSGYTSSGCRYFAIIATKG